MLEFTYVMIKPDIMRRPTKEKNAILEDIIDTMYYCGLEIVSTKREKLTKEIASEHYAHLKDKPFYNELTDFMTSGEVLEMLILGKNAVSTVRNLIGPTNVAKARMEAPNSIRAKYGNPDFGPANAIHASDSRENALIEIKRFFNIELVQPEITNNKVKSKEI